MHSMTPSRFDASRASALQRLDRFIPSAAHRYATSRNTDAGPDQRDNVSLLSPYVRYRLVTEHEITAAVLARHSLPAADKFVQEVLWRTYWKGWLEMRPSIWTRFCEERDRQQNIFRGRKELADAEQGSTGIEGFDDWAKELVETGYLHNHARMWFASIWIFTLRLPWTLGADFFLRHLLDADAASNTLSWRWVAGLQTVGKTYLATGDNIARYTNGRFAPKGLAREAIALTEPATEPPRNLDQPLRHDPSGPSLLLVTPEDMHPESAFDGAYRFKSVVVASDGAWLWGHRARQFVADAAKDAAQRASVHFACPAHEMTTPDAEALIAAAHAENSRQILTPYAPVGPAADAIKALTPQLAREGITLIPVRRNWDSLFWPHAKKGFFSFKEQMPKLLGEIGLL
jgi:deoxyribodipyrimidine photo-lyase